MILVGQKTDRMTQQDRFFLDKMDTIIHLTDSMI